MDSSALQRKPHFFKVLIGDFTQQLKMPPNFLKHISNDAPKRAILEGPNGCSWHVNIKKSSDGMFLSTGWAKFVEDHSLKEREFLVFRYNGNMHFTIQVFDTTACERDDLFEIQPCMTMSPIKGGNKKRRLRKRPLDVICHTEHQDVESGSPQLLMLDYHEAEQLQDDNVNSVEGSCVTSHSPKDDGKTKIETEELPVHLVGSETAGERGSSPKRRLVTPEERSRAGEAARAFSSDFPFVIIHMTVTNIKRYLMRFPLCFSRVHLPRGRTVMSLRDLIGKQWTVTYVPGEREQRDRLSKGWAEFVQGNNLDEGDYCAFELIGPMEMRVHIFRVVEETAPAVEAS